MKKSFLSPFIALALSLPLFAGQLGVNIDLAERGGTFVDIVKEGYRWTALTGGSDLTSAQVDSLGWPKVDAQYIVDYRPVAEWNSSIDDPQTYRIDASGTYKCAFTGQATVRGATGGSVQNASYDSASNTTSFDFVVSGPPGKDHGLFIVEFKNTKRTPANPAGSGFTGFRMLRPGYALNGSKTFTDQFVAALTGIKFSAIRFMDFTMTNGGDPKYPKRSSWSHRKHKDDASQDRIDPLDKKDGGAWEYIIALCNMANMDPWINVPISADSGYIANLATLFKDNLNPGLHIYVESSNEVWNTAPGFGQSLYSQEEADTLKIGEHENHARRTVQIAKIFSQIFGGGALNTKVRVILCSHEPMLKWWVMPMLQYISKTFGSPKNYLYAIACQTYFGGNDTTGPNVDKILSNCHNEILSQINDTGVNKAGRTQWIKLATDSGLVGGFCSYEGGPDHGGGSTDNIANRITAERDPRMGDIWKYNIDTAFFQLGGNLAMQFTLSSAYTRYGCWGLTDDITKPNRNAKYKAAQDVAARYHIGTIGPHDRTISGISNALSVTGSGKTIKIAYTLKQAGDATVSLWNIRGQRLVQRTLQRQAAGAHVLIVKDGVGIMEIAKNNYLIATLSQGKMVETQGFVMMRK